MRRKLFTFFSALSLLVCVAVCVLWVRSHFVGERLVWERDRPGSGEFRGAAVRSSAGGLELSHYSASPTDAAGSASMRLAVERQPFRYEANTSPSYPWLGSPRPSTFGFQSSRDTGLPGRRFVVPYWFLTLAVSSPAALQLASALLRRRRSRRRAAQGLCLSCGYNLRGTPDRCPECGNSREDMSP
jgi:hypothetical protein